MSLSKPKRISILGSTGSIGRSTLQVLDHMPEEFEVVALCAKNNIDLLEEQARKYCPKLIAVFDSQKAKLLQSRLPHIRIVTGKEGLIEVATYFECDLVVSAMVGSIGLIPTIEAIRAKKTIALANKEVLVMAGKYVMDLSYKFGVQILPLDSEHSAIFQCLQGSNIQEVRRLILTASGGPFRNHSQESLEKVTLEQALCHPTWKMGPKITVDSSTLMNKGFEVIEAYHLFGVSIDNIEVVIHPQSIIHSFVEFVDGSILSQMGVHDMKVPIQYALTFPKRKQGSVDYFDFTKYPQLQFYPSQDTKFICLRLAYDAIRKGGAYPCFLNAINEILVDRFLKGEIPWIQIGKKMENLFLRFDGSKDESIETLLEVDKAGRQMAKEA